MKKLQFLSVKVLRTIILISLILTACSQPSASPTQLPMVPTASLAEVSSQTYSPVSSLTARPIVNTPTAFPTFTAAAAKTVLLNAFSQHLFYAFPFRITETDHNLAEVTTITTDYAAADRYHSITTSDLNPNQDETITIGTNTWWKIKGAWSSTPSGNLPQNNFWSYIPKAQDVTYTGQAAVDGVACYIFSFSLTVQSPGLYLTGTGKAWVGVSDGLPYQFDFTPGPNVTGGPTDQVYTYGITVDIQQPVP